MKRICVVWLSIMLTFSSVFLVIPSSEDIKGEVVESKEFAYIPRDPIQINSNTDFDGEPGARAKPDLSIRSTQAPSPFHHWKLDETSGNIAYDSVGEDHGTIVGATINQTGKIGTSYWFDGSGDYVEIDDNVTLNFPLGKDFSIFAWINTTSNNGRFLSKREVPGDATGYLMQVQNGKFCAYLDFGASGAYIEGTANIADGQWHRVGMTRIGNTMEAFIDGASIGTNNNAGGDVSNGNPLLLGVEQGLTMDYTGYIDDVTFAVEDYPPIANAGPDQTVPQHTLVIFDGSASTDDFGITNYWWNFTDGVPVTLTTVSPTYTFDFEGSYLVTLTVMDRMGQTGSDNMFVTVTDGDAPVADAGPDQTGIPADIITFDGTASYDPAHLGEPIIDGIVNWTWTFDDGTGPQTIFGPSPTHQFNLQGSFLVTLTVTDAAPTPGPWTDTDTMYVNISENYNIDIVSAILSDNWILISFPSNIEGDPLTLIVDEVDEIGGGVGYVQWDIVQWFDPQSAPGTEWKTTSTFKPPSLNTFNYVNNTYGFWIHITNYGDGNLTIAGQIPTTTSIVLYTGSNLVGYPSLTGKSITEALAGTGYDVVVGYDWMAPYRLTQLSDSYVMKPGEGYWVHVPADSVWVVDW